VIEHGQDLGGQSPRVAIIIIRLGGFSFTRGEGVCGLEVVAWVVRAGHRDRLSLGPITPGYDPKHRGERMINIVGKRKAIKTIVEMKSNDEGLVTRKSWHECCSLETGLCTCITDSRRIRVETEQESVEARQASRNVFITSERTFTRRGNATPDTPYPPSSPTPTACLNCPTVLALNGGAIPCRARS